MMTPTRKNEEDEEEANLAEEQSRIKTQALVEFYKI